VGAPESRADRRPTVASILRSRIVELSPSDSLREAEALMRMGRFRTLPVVSAGRLDGLLYYNLMVRWCLSAHEEPRGSVSRRFQETRVAALMDAKPACADPADTLAEAAARLGASGSGCLPVVDAAGGFLGIVTELDVLRAARADGRDGG
jgi:CBS domain-containing protein